jgi:dipeptide transport system substrate-binding protein
MLRRAKSGEHDLVFAGWAGDNGDPDNFMTPMLSCEAAKNGENYARWCNNEFQALIDKARTGTEPAQRAALYEQALAIFVQDVPWIPLAHPKMFTALRDTVVGYTISPLSNNNFATTQVK